MSGKSLIIVIAVTAASLAVLSVGRDRAGLGASQRGDEAVRTATVEVESLQVISYQDENGNWRRPDSTLVPPVPLEGPREIAIQPDRAPAQVAGRVGSR